MTSHTVISLTHTYAQTHTHAHTHTHTHTHTAHTYHYVTINIPPLTVTHPSWTLGRSKQSSQDSSSVIMLRAWGHKPAQSLAMPRQSDRHTRIGVPSTEQAGIDHLQKSSRITSAHRNSIVVCLGRPCRSAAMLLAMACSRTPALHRVALVGRCAAHASGCTSRHIPLHKEGAGTLWMHEAWHAS